MFEVKILRSFRVQCLKILEQRIVEYVSESVASKDLPTGVDLGLFIGGDGSVINIPILQLFYSYLHSRKCAS
jgi:hypothetical protein